MTQKPARFRVIIFALVWNVLGVFSAHTHARPTAMEIFPEETLAFVRVAHARKLWEKMGESSFGRMLNDPQIRPLFEHLYGSAVDAYSQNAEEEVGLSLEELQQIPSGEIAIGLVGRTLGNPTFAVLIDMGEDDEAAKKLLARIQEEMINNGADESSDTVGDLPMTILSFGGEDETIAFCEIENTLIASANVELARSMAMFAQGIQQQLPEVVSEEDEPLDVDWLNPLTANENFVSIMRNARGAGDDPPQIVWYADPIEIFRHFSRDSLGAQVALATLPALGLDGLHGVGGSLAYGTEQYDGVMHAHVLLENPRAGVLTLLNLRSGDTKPERFTPSEWVDTYFTLHWEFERTYRKLIALVDMFQYEGAFEQAVQQNINDQIDINFEKDVIGQLDGRVSVTFGFSQPVRANRRSVLLAVHLKDVDAAKATIQKFFDTIPEPVEEEIFGGVQYRIITPPPFREMPIEDRPFEACFAFMEGCFVFSNERQMIERAVQARDGTETRLGETIDFKLVHSRVRRMNTEPGLVLFNRPEVGLRYIYDLINSDQARDFIGSQAQENEFFRTVDDALTEHPLPAFEVIAKYFAPAGGILYDTGDGIHYFQFALRRD